MTPAWFLSDLEYVYEIGYVLSFNCVFVCMHETPYYTIHTPADGVVEREGRLGVKYIRGEAGVKKQSLHEHPVDRGHLGVHPEGQQRLAQPILQQQSHGKASGSNNGKGTSSQFHAILNHTA